MDPLIVSARKYRPNLFSEVRSQSQVVTTLRNQLKHNKVPQVVLFCGLRGSGKTSCARLFAKAINCMALEASGEPCNKCVSCTQFQRGTSTNIHELDAASNNSVDDARQLLEQVRYHPTHGKKVFIIDEVHMLSNAAFNALLKTLEEPPAHVVFILATTEKHKIIPTILSRCQIFDFHPIPEEEIVAQLRYIAEKEGIVADEEALHLIGEQSDSSFREALHTFDRMVAFGGGKALTREDLLQNLQIIDPTYYFDVVDGLVGGDVGAVLQTYDRVLRLGFESQHFVKGLTKHVRNLIVAQTTVAAELLRTSPALAEAYGVQAKAVNSTFLYPALALLEACELHYRERLDKRLHVEVSLIKMARLCAGQAPKGRTAVRANAHVAVAPSEKSVSPPSSSGSRDVKGANEPKADDQKPATEEASQPRPQAPPARAETNPSRQTPLTLAQVMPHWKAYSAKVQRQGDFSAYTTMQSPMVLEGHTLVLQIPNELQKHVLQKHHAALVAFLREQLQVPDLHVTARVVPLSQEKPRPVTPQEKLHDLIERYPAVADLQQGLDLV